VTDIRGRTVHRSEMTDFGGGHQAARKIKNAKIRTWKGRSTGLGRLGKSDNSAEKKVQEKRGRRSKRKEEGVRRLRRTRKKGAIKEYRRTPKSYMEKENGKASCTSTNRIWMSLDERTEDQNSSKTPKGGTY